MCHFASFVLTKNKAYWSKESDSHERIIQEHCLGDLDFGDKPRLVRVELIPSASSPSRAGQAPADLSQWNFIVDQDLYPDWTFKGDESLRTRTLEAVARRAEEEGWFLETRGKHAIGSFGNKAYSVAPGGLALAGDYGRALAEMNETVAVAGFWGEAQSGYCGVSRVGRNGQAVTGELGVARAGDSGSAVAGNSGVAVAGESGHSVSGFSGVAVSAGCGISQTGSGGTSVSDYGGKSVTGCGGTAVAGISGKAITGEWGVARVGKGGTAQGGADSLLIFEHWVGAKLHLRVFKVGEDGVEPNVEYALGEDLKPVPYGCAPTENESDV